MPKLKASHKTVMIRYRVTEQMYQAAEEVEARRLGATVEQLEQARFMARCAILLAALPDDQPAPVRAMAV